MVTVGQEEAEKGVEMEDAAGDQGAKQVCKDAQEGDMYFNKGLHKGVMGKETKLEGGHCSLELGDTCVSICTVLILLFILFSKLVTINLADSRSDQGFRAISYCNGSWRGAK